MEYRTHAAELLHLLSCLPLEAFIAEGALVVLNGMPQLRNRICLAGIGAERFADVRWEIILRAGVVAGGHALWQVRGAHAAVATVLRVQWPAVLAETDWWVWPVVLAGHGNDWLVHLHASQLEPADNAPHKPVSDWLSFHVNMESESCIVMGI